MADKSKSPLAVALLGPKPSDDDDEGEGGDTSAAQALLDAIEAKDAKAVKAAMKLCMEEC